MPDFAKTTTRPSPDHQDDDADVHVDVIIIGTGFAGLGMATRLAREDRTSFVVLERAASVGGTWRENTYPGAACDIQSHLYSFSFRPNPDWSRIYATQPEILDYLEATAREEGLLPHIRFGAEVLDARWNESTQRWLVTTSHGRYSGTSLVAASGHLSDPKLPDIDGLESFAGDVFHTAQWDHDVELVGKRIGVVGSGASAIQIVPELAPIAGHLTVFQRSAAHIIPRADRAYSDAERGMFRRVPETAQNLRDTLFWGNEARFPQRRGVPDFINQISAVADRHRHAQIPDPELRGRLTPDYSIGCKRILISNDFYPALSRTNVSLETDRISHVDAGAVVTETGARHDVDVLVLGTGFEASDPPISYRIFDADGGSLAERWTGGAQAFASTTVSGFPNLFIMLGPNSGLGAGSIIYMVETQIDYIAEALDYLRDQDLSSMDVSRAAEEDYAQSLDERSQGTVWLSGGCESWYVDARNGRLTTLWPDFMSQFRKENGTFHPEPYALTPATLDQRRLAHAR